MIPLHTANESDQMSGTIFVLHECEKRPQELTTKRAVLVVPAGQWKGSVQTTAHPIRMLDCWMAKVAKCSKTCVVLLSTIRTGGKLGLDTLIYAPSGPLMRTTKLRFEVFEYI